MSTKLSILCERLIEAGWLLALIVTPLFFNVYSSRVFEPDKIAVLRSIALIMGLAWVIKGLETWRAGVDVRGQKSTPVSSLLSRLALLVLAAYGLSTVTSIAPRLSLWGSYERLQGLYTTSAYLLIFFSMVALLRTREQVERLITTVLVVSLPVALYGIIQHFGTDPIPWGKDVTRRVASSMGNPIFVAAFLIMTVPLTLYRLLQAEGTIAVNEGAALKLVLVIGSLFNLGLHIAAWWLGPTTGSLAALTVVGIWTLEAVILGKPLLPFVRVSGYSVLLSTQLTCILLSGSRGPWLGLLVGLFGFALVWTAARRAWHWTVAVAGSSIAALLVLLVMNLPHSPLSFVRHVPYARRLSQVFESQTSRVRLLIWQGAVPLVTADPLRAVIGYGPETMLVAYPPYYPPELGHVEKRTALPDRSHNEIFDTLITTGLLGLGLALGFCTALVYQGLQHLGLVRSPRQRHLFLGLWCLGGIGAAGLSYLIDHTGRFVGITLPLGMLAGLFGYISGYGLHGLLAAPEPSHSPRHLDRHLLVATVLAAVLAHVVEIQVGIAIASTRTVFWAWAALLLVAGRVYQGDANDAVSTPTSAPRPGRRSHRRGRRRHPQPAPPRREQWQSGTRRWLVAASLLLSTILITMVYDFLSVPVQQVHLPSVLWLFVFTWLFGGLITLTETWSAADVPLTLSRGLRHGGVVAGITLLGLWLFAAVHQGPLRLWHDPANTPVTYYVAIGLELMGIGSVLLLDERLPARILTAVGGLAGIGLAVIVVVLIMDTNLDTTRADIYFKQARVRFHDHGQYDSAIALYRRALALQPRQDFYYTFLGKAWLEKAQRARSAGKRQTFFRQAEQSLQRARILHPLHPDHAANLARLYRIWAQHTTEAEPRTARFRQALAWYAQATSRSPNNVLLWNEWGKTYSLVGDNARAAETYQHALRLDAAFAPTYLNLALLYRTTGQRRQALIYARRALQLAPPAQHPALEQLIADLQR